MFNIVATKLDFAGALAEASDHHGSLLIFLRSINFCLKHGIRLHDMKVESSNKNGMIIGHSE